MGKVYRASYKTEWIYADGYLVVRPDNTLEGVFAKDYMCIRNNNKKSVLTLKTADFHLLYGIPVQQSKIYEFYSDNALSFHSFDTFLFFTPYINDEGEEGITGLSLELKEEIFDEELLSTISFDLMEVKS